jgi:hypothetical protein
MRIGMLSGLAVASLLATLAGAAAQQKAPADPAADAGHAPEPGANSFVESQARDLLTAKGFTDVSPLVNDRQGIWRGTAKKDGSPVTVSVDYKGHVSAHP